jgi:hypothetical protein
VSCAYPSHRDALHCGEPASLVGQLCRTCSEITLVSRGAFLLSAPPWLHFAVGARLAATVS